MEEQTSNIKQAGLLYAARLLCWVHCAHPRQAWKVGRTNSEGRSGKFGGLPPASRAKTEMPAHQYESSLYATPPSGGVRFVFCAIPTGFVRVAHSTPWLLYAASPCGEAPDFRSPAARQLPICLSFQQRASGSIQMRSPGGHRYFIDIHATLS